MDLFSPLATILAHIDWQHHKSRKHNYARWNDVAMMWLCSIVPEKLFPVIFIFFKAELSCGDFFFLYGCQICIGFCGGFDILSTVCCKRLEVVIEWSLVDWTVDSRNGVLHLLVQSENLVPEKTKLKLYNIDVDGKLSYFFSFFFYNYYCY
jgi:hypothetical protein